MREEATGERKREGGRKEKRMKQSEYVCFKTAKNSKGMTRGGELVEGMEQREKERTRKRMKQSECACVCGCGWEGESERGRGRREGGAENER